MTDKLMSDDYVKSKAPTFIIVLCAGFMMLIQTLASGLAVIGYDDVIRAGAKAKEAQILQRGKEGIAFKNTIIALDIRIKELEKAKRPDNNAIIELQKQVNELKRLSHEPGG